ncbi:type III secretion system outer membrane ring subunit SctC [Pandoraea iniqua]|uniref:type III secretion system outer membrane ring subunit SctC n=1 Tax=Pandoraea iniqua TaxID=2508288 RepID=UPI0015824140|nr:type III secretion system outer membrane ring subunit SctC [Pandoraea iniqua]
MPWPDVSYSYYADNTRATQVLRDFANAFGLSLDMSSDISVRASGRYNTPTPTEFLNRITGSLGLTWFVYAGTLHISRSSDVITRSLSIPNVNVSAIRQALADLGLLDARFGWGELPDQGVVLISGPPAYVELIAKTITALPTNTVAAGQQMVVYRMQHAEVNDRQIRYRDTQVTIPGVASILRNLLERSNEVGSGKSGVTVQANRPLPGPMTPLGGFGALEREGARDSTREMSATGSSSPTNESLAAPSASPRSAASATESGTRGSLRASIEAYPYLNAVVVRDYPWRFPLYEALIKQLDVPTALIEIEAVILDVKKSSIHELGVSWGGRIGGVAAGHGVLDTAPATGTISLVTGAAGAINPATIVADAGNYLSSRIKALEQSGDAHVQSSPSVLTVDNVGAVLDLSQTFYIQTVGERVANVTPVTAGTTLRVTPRLIERNGARVIQMVIDIQDGQVVSSNQSGVLPTVSNSTISTQAIVGEGESLLIGGYNTGTKSADSDRIPFLGRLPIVGALFGTTRDEVSQRERMFLIRPRLVALPGAAPPAAAKSTQPLTQPLDTQALSAPTSLPQPFPSEMLPAPLVPTAPPPSTKPASSARTIAEPINVSRLLSRNEAAIGTDVRNIEQASYTPLPPGN